jgi:hypothetical protein
LQQQQEELEKIRRQQILEKEREMERQRQEVERLEAERARAAMASLNSGGNQNSSGSNHGSRLKRPATTTTVTAGTSRIPPRRVQGTSRPGNQGANNGASRVGAGGVRKLSGKLVMKRMAERLPLRYRDEVIISGMSKKLPAKEKVYKHCFIFLTRNFYLQKQQQNQQFTASSGTN